MHSVAGHAGILCISVGCTHVCVRSFKRIDVLCLHVYIHTYMVALVSFQEEMV